MVGVGATVECELMYYEVVGSAQPTAGGALAPSTVDPLGSCRTDFDICLFPIQTLYKQVWAVNACAHWHARLGGAVMTNVAL